LLGTVAWPLSALAERGFGLAVIPGAAGVVGAGAGWHDAVSWWDMVLVVGLVLGGFLAARRSTQGHTRPTPAAMWRAAAGGLGLGVGGSLAAGCTVGHGLTGLPLLSTGSLVAMIAIVGGVALTRTSIAHTTVTS
jgi:hypothetical protein